MKEDTDAVYGKLLKWRKKQRDDESISCVQCSSSFILYNKLRTNMTTKEDIKFLLTIFIIEFIFFKLLYSELSLINNILIAAISSVIGWILFLKITEPLYKYTYNYLKPIIHNIMDNIREKYLN